MFDLHNDELSVDVLDPASDSARLGPRFCWGGYIWQVHDQVAGPLLTGPEWPDPAPAVFNGQGLPESFRHHTLDGQPLTWRGEQGVALGAGELRRTNDGAVHVITPCSWQISSSVDRIDFATRHANGEFRYALTRRVELAGRELRSTTRLTNTSTHDALVLEWFAHPFFPLIDGLARAEVSRDASLADNPGFALTRGVLAQQRRFAGANDGHMDRGLHLPPHEPFAATLAHPTVAWIHFETSFAPDACVIWGNDRTFSFEPYLTLNLAPGAAREWSLGYRFGPSSAISSSRASARLPAAR